MARTIKKAVGVKKRVEKSATTSTAEKKRGKGRPAGGDGGKHKKTRKNFVSFEKKKYGSFAVSKITQNED